MTAAERLKRRIDSLQRGRPWLAFPVAVWKKFGDDQAGNLAALLAYFAFVSIFPLLLVLVTVLGIVLKGDTALQNKVLGSALAQFPVIGPTIQSNIHSLAGSKAGIALAIGIIGTFLGARSVATAAQNAFNTVWEIPYAERPGFPQSWLRGFALILVVGVGLIATTIVSGVAGGVGHTVTGPGGAVAAVAISLVANVGVFWTGFWLGTAPRIGWRDLLPAALLTAVVWQILQTVGGFVVAHQLRHASSLYGVFGIVLGLLAWLYLQAEATLYALEASVVHVRKLWPRSMFPPPLTAEDRQALALYAEREARDPGEDVTVRTSNRPNPTT
jgi:YihY family inner membrane protein